MQNNLNGLFSAVEREMDQYFATGHEPAIIIALCHVAKAADAMTDSANPKYARETLYIARECIAELERKLERDQ